MEDELKQHLSEMESRLTEKMRDMQTELLKAFAAYSGPTTIRLRKIEADQSNLDAAMAMSLTDEDNALAPAGVR